MPQGNVVLREGMGELGKVIGPQDTLIAAIVLQHEGTLMTNPTDVFSRVEGLRVEGRTLVCSQKRASRRDDREKAARNLQMQTALEALWFRHECFSPRS